MRSAVHKSIDDVDARQWNALTGTDSPFLRHEFLAALEHTGCVGRRTGWAPTYITLNDAKGLAAAAPVFAKTHSRGEFVFDWGWADAYHRVGLDYYPKLSVAVPFTPATGARFLVRPGLDARKSAAELLCVIEAAAAENSLSSAHALFVNEADRETCEKAGWLLRRCGLCECLGGEQHRASDHRRGEQSLLQNRLRHFGIPSSRRFAPGDLPRNAPFIILSSV